MEMIKMQYFSRLFTRKGEETRQRCVDAMRSMAERAPYWYAASVDASTDIETMMLVDGCFIIELLCKEPQDEIAKRPWTRINLFVDLLLLENQLPFVVLKELYGLIKDPTDGTDFAPQAFAELIQVLPRSGTRTVNLSTINDTNDINHLLGLVHDNWVPSSQGRPEQVISFEQEEAGQSIGSARELEEAGIEFIKVAMSDAKSLFDVSFIDGKMEIPMFVIEDNTERLFRNLIAYEMFAQGPTYVIDYVTLMDNLVNTANDVKLLRSCGVIQNMLGDDEAVAQMLNKLRDNVTLSGDTFFYEKIFVDVQQHCARPWNTWKEKLRRDYFSTPWTRISFAAALLVFLTSIIQFIISFFKKN
ncbi:hypothetical protein CRYUN_Cryun39dG0066400 [Craigia yunnanensis]